VGVETDGVDLRRGDERAAALGRLGGDELRPGEVETREPAPERQASGQERASINALMRA
jgi:hypothetical protein